jgi:ATP-dependent RNA helicase DeaD
MSFIELGINEKTLTTVDYDEPTEIQEKALPFVLSGKDVLAESATGSGKTFVFGAAVAQKLTPRKGLQALVITPTRELAVQVSAEIKKLSKNYGIGVAPVYGGVSINPQIETLKRSEVVVGTPGRLLDHMDRGTLKLHDLKILVLDEADRMLDMGFIDDIRKIISVCPKDRQTLLFSATLPKEITHLATSIMKNPVRVNAKNKVDASLLKQVYYDVRDDMKFSTLLHFLKEEKSLCMVFCNTQRAVEHVSKNLRKNGIDAVSIHGGLTQARRTESLKKFYEYGANVMVCTDVASRGLYIKGVTKVYNYDMPNDMKEYTHRIGRTARAGSMGEAINLISSRDHDNFDAILRHTSHKIEKKEPLNVERVELPKENRYSRPRGRFGGKPGAGRFGARPGAGRSSRRN